jgi:hypothetical protein
MMRLSYCLLVNTPYLGRLTWDAVSGTLSFNLDIRPLDQGPPLVDLGLVIRG